MGASAAQFEFVAEIIMFLAALAGLGLLGLRADLLSAGPRATALLGGGLAALAASAMLHGAFLPAQHAPMAVVVLRLGGAGAVFAGTLPALGWNGPRLAAGILQVGAVLVAAAAVLSFGSSSVVPNVPLVVGAVAVGTAVIHASRSAIGARMTATAAGTLLLIVVVLSAALSTVLSTTVRNDALRRLDARAAGEATALGAAPVADLRDAKLVMASIEGYGVAQPAAAGDPAAVAQLRSRVDLVSSEFFSDVHLLWVGQLGQALAVSPGFAGVLGPVGAPAVAALPLVRYALVTQRPLAGLAVVAGRGVALGVYPDQVRPAGGGATRAVGAAVTLTVLDDGYLANQARDDPSLRLALADGATVLAAYPRAEHALPLPVLRLAAAALATRPAAATSVGGDFVVVRQVPGVNGQPVMGLVAEAPTTVFDRTRDSLFRTLFLIALGGSLLAFLLSVMVSERISRGLQRLTAAARRISRGDRDVRAGVSSPDEIGVLAQAFDTMAESIEDKTAALRLAAEEEARLRGRLESVVGGMAEALVAVDGTGRVTDFNRAAEQLVGLSRARAVGRPLERVLPVTLADGRPLAPVATDPAQLPLSAEGTVVDASGAEVPVAVAVAAVVGGEGVADGAVALLRDLRRELELERMKTEFLSRIGHELRTPLAGIVGFSELLARRPVPADRARSWHEEILAQARRLTRTVEMLEFFASAGGNRVVYDLRPVPPGAVVEQLADRWEEKLGAGHVLTHRVDRGLPEVLADPRWLGLALDELVDNAVKFSPDGGRVAVEATNRPDDATVALTVRDSGNGMSAAEQQAALGEFTQGDTSDTRRFGGLGLGLALARRVAEGHGGVIEFDSSGGQGSAVSLVLPAAAGAANGRRRRRRQPVPTMADGRDPTA